MREVGNPILFFTPYRRHRLTYVARSSGLTRDLCINRSQSYRRACSHSNANKVKKEVERKRLTSLQKWIELEASMEFYASFKNYCTTVSRYDNNYSVFKQNKSFACVRKICWSGAYFQSNLNIYISHNCIKKSANSKNYCRKSCCKIHNFDEEAGNRATINLIIISYRLRLYKIGGCTSLEFHFKMLRILLN